MSIKEYQEQQDELFNYIVDKGFLRDFKTDNPNKDLEFIITPECNLSCKYCYFTNHRDEIYPKNVRNNSSILDNINTVLNWIVDNSYHVRKLNLFSGDIWHIDLGQSILGIVFNTLRNFKFTNTVMIASNMTWVDNYECFKLISNWVDKYKNIGVNLCISCSIDGKVIEDITRPKTSGNQRSENFYENIAKFAELHSDTVGFHPMVSAISAKYWIDNYKWWDEYLSGIKGFSLKHSITMLEVRNDDWTDEAIDDYLKFLEFRFLHEKDVLFKYNKKDFVSRIYHFGRCGCTDLSLVNKGYKYNCGIQNTLYIRAGDLSIVPCHRLSYNKFIYGKFDNMYFKASNPELMAKIILTNPTQGAPLCESCDYKFYCMKGCLGAQHESSDEMFHPCKSVCKLMKAKIHKLLELYDKYDLLDPQYIFENFPDKYSYWYSNYQIFTCLMENNKEEEM